jgi:hypothetical protein
MPAAKTTKKRKKPESATCYAIRRKSDGKWWTADVGEWGTFAKAYFYSSRPFTWNDCVTVPCRVRPLPSAKRNRTRTA